MNTEMEQAQQIIRDAQILLARCQKQLDEDGESDQLDYEIECWHAGANEIMSGLFGGKL